MHAAMVKTIVPGAARIDAPATAIAKAPDDGRFCETLKAGVTGEPAADAMPATPVTASVGNTPVAMMRPPDVSSPEDAVARPATKAHEQEHSTRRQDTGTVSVAKEAAKRNSDETSRESQPIVPEAASPTAVLQPLPMPLPAVTLAAPAEVVKPAVGDSKAAVAGPKSAMKKNEIGAANVVIDARAEAGAATQVLAPQPATAQTKQDFQAAGSEIVPTHVHIAKSVETIPKSAVTIEPVAKTIAPTDAPDIRTLAATPNVLEVGIATGTHGWLRVRAELGQMGEVTASLAAGSASAAEGLHKELPAISAYLSSERVGVSSLVVNATEKNAATASAGEQSGSRDQRQPSRTKVMPASDDGGGVELDFMGMSLPAAIYASGSGSWLSVRV